MTEPIQAWPAVEQRQRAERRQHREVRGTHSDSAPWFWPPDRVQCMPERRQRVRRLADLPRGRERELRAGRPCCWEGDGRSFPRPDRCEEAGHPGCKGVHLPQEER